MGNSPQSWVPYSNYGLTIISGSGLTKPVEMLHEEVAVIWYTIFVVLKDSKGAHFRVEKPLLAGPARVHLLNHAPAW